jgi:hypothetical protein
MSRTAAALLAAALLLAAPGSALGKGEGDPAKDQPAPRAEKAEQPAPRPEASKEEDKDLRVLPIYIPPSRGSVPTRVGGGSRGEPHFAQRL